MSLLDSLGALTLFVAVSSATPGPNNLMLLSSGTRFGFARTVPHMLGVMLGYALMVALVGLGLSRIFLMLPWLQTGLKVASIIYLLYLAYKIATSTPPTLEDGEGRGKPLTFLQAAAFQWVNPKGWTMALTACSAYMPPLGPTLGALVIAAVSVVVNIPVVALWTAMGMHLRRLLAEPYKLRLFNWTAAALLVASLYPVIRSH